MSASVSAVDSLLSYHRDNRTGRQPGGWAARAIGPVSGKGKTAALKLARDALVPVAQMGDGRNVVQVSMLLASDEAKHIAGIEPVVDGGITLKVK